MRIRRSTAVVLRYQYLPIPVAGGHGRPAYMHEERLVAVATLTGAACVVDDQTLPALSAIPSDRWMEVGHVIGWLGMHPGTLSAFLNAGLLVCDDPSGPWAALAARDRQFAAIDWNESAAHYHMMSRVRDQNAANGSGPRRPVGSPEETQADFLRDMRALASTMDEAMEAQVARRGPPPAPFHQPGGVQSSQALPAPGVDDPFITLLTERKTDRVFDGLHPVTAQELSTLLYYTYGVQGLSQPATGHVSLRKTSPSGGSLHPIEAYPLVIRVEGLESGLYHYNVQRHTLDLLRPLPRVEAERLAEIFVLGQSYFRSASAMVVMTARWYRSFWKYPKAHKAYRVVHIDAGHLSQTWYLLCGQLGLGAFFTGAVNDVNIEEALAIDPLEEGVIGLSGVGRPLSGGCPLNLERVPHTPPDP